MTALVASYTFDHSQIYQDGSVKFTDTSTGSPDTWQWNFGDGSDYSADQNPTHVYSVPGNYKVTLTVSIATPVASFGYTPSSGTIPLSVSFTDTSTGQITSWLWDFDDGTTSTLQNPTHVYEDVNTYSPSLTVTGPGGISDPVSHDVVANPISSPTLVVRTLNSEMTYRSNYSVIGPTPTGIGGALNESNIPSNVTFIDPKSPVFTNGTGSVISTVNNGNVSPFPNWCVEMEYDTAVAGCGVALGFIATNLTTFNHDQIGGGAYYFGSDGTWSASDGTSTGNPTYGPGDIVAISWDFNEGVLFFWINGVSQYQSGDSYTANTHTMTYTVSSYPDV